MPFRNSPILCERRCLKVSISDLPAIAHKALNAILIFMRCYDPRRECGVFTSDVHMPSVLVRLRNYEHGLCRRHLSLPKTGGCTRESSKLFDKLL